MKAITRYLNPNSYFHSHTEKRQVYIHHTVSSSVVGTIGAWNDTTERVGAHIIIDRDGTIVFCLPLDKWVHHLGLRHEHFKGVTKPSTNALLNAHSIGVELINWGGLRPVHGKEGAYYNAYDKMLFLPKSDIVQYSNYRGFSVFQRYTPQQIDALSELLPFLKGALGIDTSNINKNANRLFAICHDALQGKPGIYPHGAVRPDKSDAHPQIELITLLNTL